MHTHHSRETYPYSPEQVFDLVIDIESYPTFLPWCAGARICENTGEVLTADLIIRFKAFQEKYTSRVSYARPSLERLEGYITVELVEGPFSHLKNIWKFESTESGNTTVEFHLDFQFRSKLLDKLMGMMFESAQKKMLEAFRSRASLIYGQN